MVAACCYVLLHTICCALVVCASPTLLLQLVVGDSPLNLNLMKLVNVSGTFQMGTPSCPIQSLINIYIPGGDPTTGVFVMPGAKYDVHAYTQVGVRDVPDSRNLEYYCKQVAPTALATS